jgi:tRNA A37 threonylcarbamoyladenosine biosynthesis protein TsaE
MEGNLHRVIKIGNKKMKEIILRDIFDTRTWAAEFAKTLRVPQCVALHGDLGMGKSEIARAIIQTLCGADTVVPSPTFTLVQGYEIGTRDLGLGAESISAQSPVPSPQSHISHFDLYRIQDVSELEEIGLSHAIANDITLIEWPEIAMGFLPPDTIHIYITEFEGGRKIDIRYQILDIRPSNAELLSII